MKYLQKLTKGQIIYQLTYHNGRIHGIYEKEVISCGKKILKLKGKWNNDDFRINQQDGVFSKIGFFKNPIEQFHLTLEGAEKYKEDHNN